MSVPCILQSLFYEIWDIKVGWVHAYNGYLLLIDCFLKQYEVSLFISSNLWLNSTLSEVCIAATAA